MSGAAQKTGKDKEQAKGLLEVLVSRCRSHLLLGAAFALFVDVLYLASPIYLINVYDRVLSSGSRYTLVMLSIALGLALIALALLDDARTRLLIRAGIRIDREVAVPLMRTLIRAGSAPGGHRNAQALRDLDNFRQVVTGPGIAVFFDAPWTPIFSIVLYYMHPLLGLEAIFGAVVLLILALMNEFAIRRVMFGAANAARDNYVGSDDIVRNAEVVRSMGMESALLGRWSSVRRRYLDLQAIASGRASVFAAAIKFVRYGLQALVVATAVWLILDQKVSPGVIFPAMLLLGRALAPVEQAVSAWKSLVGARQSFDIVSKLVEYMPAPVSSLRTDKVLGTVEAEQVSLVIKGRERPVLRGVGFVLRPGEALGIVGANGSGKSSLARLIVGVWKPSMGTVRIDGADTSQLHREDVSRFIGYLPQDVQLLAGSIKENIAHFQQGEDGKVIAAGRLARIHEQILRLPEGYDTQVGEGGVVLSAGLRQRVALARALYADPAVIVLDEPNSNLDADAEAALMQVLQELKGRNRTVILVAHRPSLMSVVDRMLVLNEGVVEAQGVRSEILPRITKLAPVRATVPTAGEGS